MRTSLVAVPSSPTLRQRMGALAESGDAAFTGLDEANERLLRRAKPTLTPLSSGLIKSMRYNG